MARVCWRFWFHSSLEENPEWNPNVGRSSLLEPVSILTRGKPRVERIGNLGGSGKGGGFNPHSRKTPSGTTARTLMEDIRLVSILTRGKPRVERARPRSACR